MASMVRPWQSSGTDPGKFWAAVANGPQGTTLGLYDTNTFRFVPRMSLPDLRISMSQFWVEPNERQVFVAYEGHLLRFDWPNSAKP